MEDSPILPEVIPAKAPPSSPIAAKVIYTCPMHPEIEQDHPGKCPKCGMTLVPKKGNP